MHALRGAHNLLERDHPDIVVEVTDEFLSQMGDSAAGLYEFLEARGYRAYRIGWRGLVRDYNRGEPRPRQYNALFTTRVELPATLLDRDEARASIYEGVLARSSRGFPSRATCQRGR